MRKLVVLMAVLALLGAGCGDDKADNATDDGASASGSTAVSPDTPFHGTAKATDGMELELDNFYFGPTVIDATAGQSFKVELFNEGSVPHTFTVDSLGIDQTLNPEERLEVTITAPATAGTVPFYCRIHQAASHMQGALVVA